MDLKGDSYSFWEQVELGLNQKISPHIKNTFHICGYSNPLSWVEFCDDDVVSVEKYVQQDLQTIIEKKYQNANETFNPAYKKLFFGAFDFDTTMFRYQMGEKRLLFQIKLFVVDKLAKGVTYFNANHNISAKNTIRMPLGFFFGDSDHSVQVDIEKTSSVVSLPVFFKNDKNEIEKSIENTIDKSDQSKNKAKKLEMAEMESVKLDSVKSDLIKKYSLLIHPLKEREDYSEPVLTDATSIDQTNSSIRATIICVFCKNMKKKIKKNKIQKGHSVQGVMSKSSSLTYWNFSNYKKHLRLIHKIEATLLTGSNMDANFENTKESSTEIKKIEAVPNEDEMRGSIFNRISAQILKMTQAVLMNREVLNQFSFKINNKLMNAHIVKIKGDGTCLFGSLTHQIHGVEVDSDEHQQLIEHLRLEAIDFIRSNIEDFEMALKGELIHSWERNSSKKLGSYGNFGPEIWKKEFHDMLNFQMPLKSYWGGAATIKAVADLYKANILIANENGDVFFSVYKEEFTKTLMLAYRLSSLGGRNHYDSITGMENEVMYACAEKLSKTNSVDAEEDSDCYIE